MSLITEPYRLMDKSFKLMDEETASDSCKRCKEQGNYLSRWGVTFIRKHNPHLDDGLTHDEAKRAYEHYMQEKDFGKAQIIAREYVEPKK